MRIFINIIKSKHNANDYHLITTGINNKNSNSFAHLLFMLKKTIPGDLTIPNIHLIWQ